MTMDTHKLNPLMVPTEPFVDLKFGKPFPVMVQEFTQRAADLHAAADPLTQALQHLHWLTRGGEFAAWVRQQEMPLAAAREWQEALEWTEAMQRQQPPKES